VLGPTSRVQRRGRSPSSVFSATYRVGWESHDARWPHQDLSQKPQWTDVGWPRTLVGGMKSEKASSIGPCGWLAELAHSKVNFRRRFGVRPCRGCPASSGDHP
jgi:hypothetical protein